MARNLKLAAILNDVTRPQQFHFRYKRNGPVPLNSFLERMFMRGALYLYHNKAKSVGEGVSGWGGGGETTFPQTLVRPPPTLYVSVKSKRHQLDLLTKSQGCQLFEIL